MIKGRTQKTQNTENTEYKGRFNKFNVSEKRKSIAKGGRGVFEPCLNLIEIMIMDFLFSETLNLLNCP